MSVFKNDGYDGLTSDYSINGTQLLFHYLSILFVLMLAHCYAPSSFCFSTMVPIPKKSSGSIGEITNYRGTALSGLLSKISDKDKGKDKEILFQVFKTHRKNM